MLKRTKKDNSGMWHGLIILRDPAPSPLDDETIKHLKKMAKALIKAIKKAWSKRKE